MGTQRRPAKNNSLVSCQGPLWRAGLYIRLSKEEASGSRDQSNSVRNQKALLAEYCMQHPNEFAHPPIHYVDDGYSGTDTMRAGFQLLLADVHARRINCVMVKDLSRLSRNYADAGSLIEQLFVQLDVRFISLAEGVDSYLDPESASSLIVPITNVINDNFCYQTSKKIRQVLDYKRRSGAFIGSFAAYGYRKDPGNKNALLVDGQAARVVRQIYEYYLSGMSKKAIVRTLNAQGIPCPSQYKKEQGLRYRHPSDGTHPLWSAKTVHDILKNQLYTGYMVQGRQRVKSYKIHTQQSVPQERWYIVPNTHPPIIRRDIFNQVQHLLGRDTRTPPGGQGPHLFSGLLRCADCGRAMCRSRSRQTVYYICRTYKEQSKSACTKHSIRDSTLQLAVLESL